MNYKKIKNGSKIIWIIYILIGVTGVNFITEKSTMYNLPIIENQVQENNASKTQYKVLAETDISNQIEIKEATVSRPL